MTAFTFDASQRIVTSNNAINSYSNGLPFDSSGALVVADDILAPVSVQNGFPTDANDAVAVDSVTSASYTANGLPLTANGRIAVDGFTAVSGFQNGLPLTTDKLSVSSDGLWYASADLELNAVLPSLVHQYDQNRYYDSTQGSTSFPFTSTRTTNAMQYDASGNLVWGPHQLCTRGQDFTSWSMGSDGTIALSGNTAPTNSPSYLLTWASASPTTGIALVNQPCLVGASNTYSVYLRYVNHQWARVAFYSSSTAANQVRCWVDLENQVIGTSNAGGAATLIDASVTAVGNGWVRVVLSGTIPFTSTTDASALISTASDNGSTTRVGRGAAIESASAIFEMWGPQAPQTWRNEFATAGAAWYGPRFDYDPYTGEAMGLLVEESRTNIISKSFNLITTDVGFLAGSNATGPTYLGGWPSVRTTADGTLTAHGSYPDPNITPTGSSFVSLTATIHPGANTFLQLTGSTNWIASTAGYANFNVTGAGSVTATGADATNAWITRMADGVYRIGVTINTIAVPVAGKAAIVAFITSGTDLRLPSNSLTTHIDYISATACQGVQGWHSVIPTFGTTTTKAADIVTKTTGSWLDQTKGTMYCEFMRSYVEAGAGNAQNFAQISDGTNNNRMVLLSGIGSYNSHRFDTVVATVNVAQCSTTVAATAFTVRKMVGSYELNNFRGCENGGAVSSDVVGTVPGASNRLDIGGALTASQIGGWIREFRYYPDVSASNAQLQTLTT